MNTHVEPVATLEIGDNPSESAANLLASDFRVPSRHQFVSPEKQVALGAANDKPHAANANNLARRLAVVADDQKWYGRPMGWSKRVNVSTGRRRDRVQRGVNFLIRLDAGFGPRPVRFR